MEISNGWKKKNVGFVCLINKPEIYKVTDKNGESVNPPKQGILIPEKLAEVLNVKPNDMVYVKPLLPGKEKNKVYVKGIVAQYIGLSAYSSLDNTGKLLGEGTCANSAVLKLDRSTSEKEVINALKNMSAVSLIQSKSDSLNNLLENMASMNSSMAVMIILAAVLSIAVIYNITSINIFERQRELATLKVLGLKVGEIKKLVFNEGYIISILGALLGLPLGIWLGTYMMMSMATTDAYSFPFVVSFKSCVFTFVLTLVFTAAAHFILTKKIKSIDMIAVLKNNE
jgi:putative ABC transport system permease protein